MNLNRFILIISLSLIMAGCATPPGQFTDEDFRSKSIDTEFSVNEAMSNLYEGLRFCGPFSGGFFKETLHGIPDCSPMRPDGSASCDLYVASSSGIRSSSFVLGRVDFQPSDNGSIVTLRVINHALREEAILTAWEKMVNGNPEQACKKD